MKKTAKKTAVSRSSIAEMATEKKEPVTIRIPHKLAERLRNTVYWTPGLTLAGITEKALEHTIDALEKENGKPFPQRQGNVKTGRPLS